MAYTRLQLVDFCKRKTKLGSDPASETGFEDDLNEAINILASVIDFPELDTEADLSLADGTETYNLASDVYKVDKEAVRIISPATQEKDLIWKTKKFIRIMHPVTTNDSEAIPTYAYLIEPTLSALNVPTKRMSFYPIPDSSYTVRYNYIRNAPLMNADDAQPFFNEKFHRVLSAYTIWQHAEREADETLNPNYWENQWLDGMARMIEYYPTNEEEGPIDPIPVGE
jgi:hypothetical protein